MVQGRRGVVQGEGDPSSDGCQSFLACPITRTHAKSFLHPRYIYPTPALSTEGSRCPYNRHHHPHQHQMTAEETCVDGQAHEGGARKTQPATESALITCPSNVPLPVETGQELRVECPGADAVDSVQEQEGNTNMWFSEGTNAQLIRRSNHLESYPHWRVFTTFMSNPLHHQPSTPLLLLV